MRHGLPVELEAMTIYELLDLLDDYDPADLSKVNALLLKILIYAAGFYDDGCECNLRCSAVYLAYIALQDDSIGNETAAALAHEMAYLAGQLLEQAEFSAETRVRLERIRDTDPECAEPATATNNIVEKMLKDEDTKKKMIGWALAYALARNGSSKTERELAWQACKMVTAIWRQTIFPSVLAQLSPTEAASAKPSTTAAAE